MDDQGRRSGFGWSEYGAVACLWCRNFFRQAHWHSGSGGVLDPANYACSNKSGGKGKCDYFSQIYRCRRCKYDRCVEVGMKQSLVDGGEEAVSKTANEASGGQCPDLKKG